MASIEVRSPATGELVDTYTNDPIEHVAEALEEARAAQKNWAAKSFHSRAEHLQKMKMFLSKNAERAVQVICACTGKTKQDALGTEVLPCVLACDWYASNTQKVLRSKKVPSGSILFFNKSNTLVYEPIGVVGIISPWNYPFSIPFGEVLMGLMAGNGVLLKVASNMAPVGKFIEEVMAAGELPQGLFCHLLLSGAQCGSALLSAGIDKLFFTGSVRVGKQLMAEAAQTLTPVSLELGGNDGMVVLRDADLERAVNCACWAGFQNAGQSCGGVERIYVEEAIYDEFLAAICDKTSALRHGPDSPDCWAVDIGSITTKSQYDSVMAQLQDALSKGAVVAAQSQAVGDCSKGYFIPATVLTGCTMEMTVMKEETFGPILPVIKVQNEEEAILLANDCTLALTSSVFSQSKSRAWRVAHRLHGGVVSINDHLYTHGMSEAPWGGWKESGIGRTHGYLGLKEMSNVKCINDDCWPLNRNLWWYPFSNDTYKTLMAALRLVAPTRCGEGFCSLFHLARSMSFMVSRWVVPTSTQTKNIVKQ